MDRRQIETFLAVVDFGSMSRAATNLQVSQPTISQTIRALERRVRTPLFFRKGSRLVLTAAGTSLVGPARRILRDFEEARRAVAGIVDVDTGRIDISMPAILARYPGIALITAFAKRHPDVFLSIEDQTSVSSVRDSVSSGHSEIGFVTTLEDPTLKSILLGRHALTLVLPPGSPNGGEPATLEEISQQRLISGPPLGFSSRITIGRELAARGLRFRRAIRIAHRQAIPELVLAGIGATIMIGQEAEELAAEGAVVRPTDPPFSRPFYLIHRPDELSATAQEFVSIALELAPHFGSDPRAGGIST